MEVRLDREALLGTRNALISRGLLETPHLVDDVRDPILRSWRRCVSASTPLEQLRTRRIEHPSPSQLLGRAAAPVMDRLRDELADLGVAVLLSNRSGRIIARRVADSLQRDRLDDNYVLEGFATRNRRWARTVSAPLSPRSSLSGCTARSTSTTHYTSSRASASRF